MTTCADTRKKSFLRDVVGQFLVELGERDKRVVVVNADLMGTNRNKTFVERFPQRSFNVGIAEQNMISFSAGLAYEGFIPYANSMAPFITMRACEQCRTDVAYGKLNVRLLGTYAGVSGGISGATHWAIEDCGIMTSIPGMAILEPCDAAQAKKMLLASLDYVGPIYMRISVEPQLDLYDDNYQFSIGKATLVKDGEDGAFICSGVTVQYALIAAERLRELTGRQVRVIDMHTIKPIDIDAIISAAQTGRIVVAQDHNIIGGLGSIVAMVLSSNGLAPKFKVLGVPDKFETMAHAQYLYHKFGFDADGLTIAMEELLEERKNR